jgi:hypothetical protein
MRELPKLVVTRTPKPVRIDPPTWVGSMESKRQWEYPDAQVPPTVIVPETTGIMICAWDEPAHAVKIRIRVRILVIGKGSDRAPCIPVSGLIR